MSASEIHNRLAREFVMKVVKETKIHSELMVVVESVILAAITVSQRVYGLSPAGSVEMVEATIQQATDRFAAQARSS